MARRVEEFYVQFAADNSGYRNAMKGAAKDSETFLDTENKVKRALVSTTGVLNTTTSGYDALADAIGSMENAFKSSLGIGAAIVVGLKLKDVLTEDAKRMEALAGAAANVFSNRGMAASVGTIGELSAGYDKAREAAEAYRNENARLDTVIGKIRNALTLPFGGEIATSQQSRNTELATDLDKESLRIQTEMRKVEEARADIAEHRAAGENEIADNLEKQARREREIFEASKAHNEAGYEAIRRRHAAEDALEERQQTFQEIELDFQARLSEAARSNNDIELAGAEALYEKRKAILDLAKDPIVRAQAASEADAAYTALRTARNNKEQQIENLSLAKQISELSGSDFERQQAALKLQEESLRRQLADPRTNNISRIGILTELNNNTRAQQSGQDSQNQNWFGMMEKQASLGARSMAQQVQAQRTLYQLKLAQLKAEEASENRDEAKVMNLRLQLQEQAEGLKMMAAEERIRQANVNAEQKQLDIERSTLSESAKRYEITKAQLAAVNEEIDAMRELNPELAQAAALRAQGLTNDLQRQDEANNFGKTGQQIRQRLRQEERAQRALNKYRAEREENKGLIDVQRDVNGNVISGIDPNSGSSKRVNILPPDPLDKGLSPIGRSGRLLDEKAARDEEFRKRFARPGAAKDIQIGEPEGPTREDMERGREAEKGEAIVRKLDEIKKEIIASLAH